MTDPRLAPAAEALTARLRDSGRFTATEVDAAVASATDRLGDLLDQAGQVDEAAVAGLAIRLRSQHRHDKAKAATVKRHGKDYKPGHVGPRRDAEGRYAGKSQGRAEAARRFGPAAS